METIITTTVHDLKIAPEHFERLKSRKKRFELRKNDRNFKQGDILILNEYKKEDKTFTGQKLLVLSGKVYQQELKFGLRDNFCVIEVVFREEFNEEQNDKVNEYLQTMF